MRGGTSKRASATDKEKRSGSGWVHRGNSSSQIHAPRIFVRFDRSRTQADVPIALVAAHAMRNLISEQKW